MQKNELNLLFLLIYEAMQIYTAYVCNKAYAYRKVFPMNPILRFMVPGVFSAVIFFGAGQAFAQAHAAPVAAADKTLMVKNVYGLESNARLRTPVYNANGGGKIVRTSGSVVREWVQVVAEYVTVPDAKARWMDQVSFQFYVLTVTTGKEIKQPEYTVFRGQVAYMDVDRNRRDSKWATLYLRPTVLARYGEPIAVAVEASVNGKLVDVKAEVDRRSQEMLSGQKEWWKNPRLAVKDGYLLKAADTPFAFINYDDFEETVQ